MLPQAASFAGRDSLAGLAHDYTASSGMLTVAHRF